MLYAQSINITTSASPSPPSRAARAGARATSPDGRALRTWQLRAGRRIDGQDQGEGAPDAVLALGLVHGGRAVDDREVGTVGQRGGGSAPPPARHGGQGRRRRRRLGKLGLAHAPLYLQIHHAR